MADIMQTSTEVRNTKETPRKRCRKATPRTRERNVIQTPKPGCKACEALDHSAPFILSQLVAACGFKQ